jgi:hypothetical protein
MLRALGVVAGIIWSMSLFAQTGATETHPREQEAVETATSWLDLVENGEAEKSYELFADSYQSSISEEHWKASVKESNAELGALRSRKLKRVVFYQDPENAPLPGTYAAVEFDSVYENARKHFQYIILHSLSGEPFRVMRLESKVLLIPPEPE